MCHGEYLFNLENKNSKQIFFYIAEGPVNIAEERGYIAKEYCYMEK